MPLDALFFTGLTGELSAALAGAKIDKIYQPARDEVVLALRAAAGNCRLLLCANPRNPRAQLTRLTLENPEKPPMFCMLLRKHLTGARVTAVHQPPLERVLRIHLDALDELGDRVPRQLVLEAMGRHSNLILLDDQERIVDCLRRVDSDMSQRRQVLPGLFYDLPPTQEKHDPAALNRQELDALLAAAPAEVQADKWLLNTFGGLSPLICRELAFRAGGSTDVRLHQLGSQGREELLSELERLLRQVGQGEIVPTILRRDGKEVDFTFLPVLQYGPETDCLPCPTFSALLDQFYENRDTTERVRQKGQDLIRAVTNARDRSQRKLAIQEKELTATEERDHLRQMGDILTANFHQMERGISSLRTLNFYDPEGGEIEIPLNPLLTPQQNAAKYYKDYTRAKTAQERLTEQIQNGRRDLEYLNSVLDSISRAEGERDLMEIRQEMAQGGYLRRVSPSKGREKKQAVRPLTFHSSSGLKISVGKNNTQNDLLTTKLAFKSDLWFHTQKIHGSHVILWTEGQQPDSAAIHEAACLAAWFSQGRESGKVPVDYTPVKYVKKPAGARPGMVVYTTYETALVTPDGELVKKLSVK